jgi:hypothetical protein
VDGFDDLKADPDDVATAGDEVEVAAGRDGAEGVELAAGGEPDAEHAVDAPAEQPSVEPDTDADDEDGRPGAAEEIADGSPGAAEETADAMSPAGEFDGDAVARPDGSDAETDVVTPDGAERIASGSVVRAGDATPSAGEEAPSPGVDDSTDGPDRVDG